MEAKQGLRCGAGSRGPSVRSARISVADFSNCAGAGAGVRTRVYSICTHACMRNCAIAGCGHTDALTRVRAERARRGAY